MTDLKDQLAALFEDEPPLPHDIDRVLRLGRRAVRSRRAWAGAAATAGAAGVTAAVVLPLTGGGGPTAELKPAHQPGTAPATPHCKLYMVAGGKDIQKNLAELRKQARGTRVLKVRSEPHGVKVFAACPPGATPAAAAPAGGGESPPPAGPPYDYTEHPATIAADFGEHLRSRVQSFGLTITYTRPFAQESSTLENGHPNYFDGNVDVRESQGYGDIGVQVTHEVTEQVPFTGPCDSESGCEETTLPDGSVLRTGRVDAGGGGVVRTAEVHRPDGLVVAAQESNYAFGPDAASEPHGSQPLSLDQLMSLAKDAAFSF